MLTPYSVQDTLKDPQLDESWNRTLAEWEDAAHSQLQATLAYVRGLRNQILNVTSEIDSMEELERILALGYIDLKCQWSILNVQIQYAVAHRGEIREDLMYRATCVTHLLEAVEGLLSQSDVDAMTEMISAPVGSGGLQAAAPPTFEPLAAPTPTPDAPAEASAEETESEPVLPGAATISRPAAKPSISRPPAPALMR